MIGRTFGNYRTVQQLGQGGMGVVYRAEHTLIGQSVAIKIVLPELCQNQRLVTRFFNEARAAAVIKHPGIVDIFDFGYTEDNIAYIVMEFLDGLSLTDYVAQNTQLEDADVTRIIRQVASALEAAHRAEIIHRDLKPDNIFLVSDPEVLGGQRVKVLDFGIAKLNDDAQGPAARTRTGAVMGSPAYMSPEQCRGAGAVDWRSDIYSLGCVMYEMVTGAPPFVGGGTGTIIAKHLYEPPPPVHRTNAPISPGLEAVIVRALAKEPGDRFQSMQQLLEAVDQLSFGRFPTPAPVPRAASSVLQTAAPYNPPKGVAPIAPTVVSPGGSGNEPAFVRSSSHVPVQPRAPIPSGHVAAQTPPRASAVAITTLGSAASEVTDIPEYRPPRGRVWLAPAIVLGLFGAAGAVVALTAGGDDDKQEAAPAAQPEKPPEPEPEPPVVEEIKEVTFRITSEPSGAKVLDANGTELGTTPFEKAFDSGDSKMTLTLERKGYDDAELTLGLDQDQREVVMLVNTKKRLRHERRAKRRETSEASDTPVSRPTKRKTDRKTPKGKKRDWGGALDPFK